MIELLFTSTPGPFGAAIRWRTASPWSHVDAVLPGGDMVLGATLLHGVAKRTRAAALRYATAYGTCHFEVPDPDGFYEYLHENEGGGYGIGEILGFVLGRPINSPQHFCSELIGRAAANGKRRFGRRKPELLTPADIWDSDITEGNRMWRRRYPWHEWTEVDS